MKRYVVATAALTLLVAAAAVAFAIRGGGTGASSAGPLPAAAGAPSASTGSGTTAGATTEASTTEARTTASPASCSAQVFLPVLRRELDNEAQKLRIVEVEVARCRNGYAQVFAVPDRSVCQPGVGYCYETEQVFLRWTSSRWRILTYGTGITCEAGGETAPVVRRVCERLGYPQATRSSAPAAPPDEVCGPRATWNIAPDTGGGDAMSPDAIYRVKSAEHTDCDRVVFWLNGPHPVSFRVAYVPVVHQDPSDQPLPVAGGAALEVTVRAPAKGYDNQGHQPGVFLAHPGDYIIPPEQVAGWGALRGLRFGGTFEGVSTFALGVKATRPFRAFTMHPEGLPEYTLLVIDVAH
jgi:hypothetical protein